MVYDGDCGFCRFWIARWKKITGGKIRYAPFQEVGREFPDIPPEQFQKSVRLILPNGRVLGGAHAVFRALASAPEKRWMLRAYRKIPGVALLCELCYRIFAENRGFFSLLTALFVGGGPKEHSFVLARWLFVKVLGAVYFFAFLSFFIQSAGLVGSEGILPAENFLAAVRENMGPVSFWSFPTLAWFNASDALIQFLGLGGALLSFFLIAGIAITPVLIVLWLFYLSLFTVGQVFTSYQWDILLLEVGFLAIFLTNRSAIILWLFRWLLFRLIFLSGAVKLLSGDAAWRNFTALNFHFETQPLPNMLAWYAHQLPEWFQRTSVGAMFFVQLVVPFFIFAPRRFRFFAAFSIAFLEFLILLTGNYTFFNILTISLCIFLLDDTFLRRVVPRSLFRRIFLQARSRFATSSGRTVLVVGASVIIFVSTFQMTNIFFGVFPKPAEYVAKVVRPAHLVNTYGLFAVMTTTRTEIIIEGSYDGETWLEYGFAYKPDDVRERPRQVAPHQPRLDWQMWFEGLRAERAIAASDDPSAYRPSPWFRNLIIRLLQGAPSVLALLDTNPFLENPPTYVRAVAYDYYFTSPAEKRKTGAWWKREKMRVYLPAVSLAPPG